MSLSSQVHPWLVIIGQLISSSMLCLHAYVFLATNQHHTSRQTTTTPSPTLTQPAQQPSPAAPTHNATTAPNILIWIDCHAGRLVARDQGDLSPGRTRETSMKGRDMEGSWTAEEAAEGSLYLKRQ